MKSTINEKTEEVIEIKVSGIIRDAVGPSTESRPIWIGSMSEACWRQVKTRSGAGQPGAEQVQSRVKTSE